jgi:hypothetical protein
MSNSTPAVSDQLPEDMRGTKSRRRRRSRYDRPRSSISWFGVILGLILGMSVGLYYTWVIEPVQNINVAPWQLDQEDLDHYLIAIILNYSYDGDLALTIERLNDLRLPGDDSIQAVADAACRLASTGFVNNSTGLRAVRSMMAFYRGQGRSGCADSLGLEDTQLTAVPAVIVVDTPTPMPPASKTPTPLVTGQPTSTSARPFVPTNSPSRDYDLLVLNSFCDADIPGVIEVRVRDYSGAETPGIPIRVRWNGGESLFFTGLKPERGEGYADFVMEEGLDYIVEMPGLSDPIPNPISAAQCVTEAGGSSRSSYRLIFQGE